MRGSIVKRGSGYSIVYRAPDPASGLTKQVWKAGYATKREAEAALKEIVSQVDVGTYARPTKQTVAQYLNDDWLPSLDSAVAGGSLKATTAAFYRGLAGTHIIPRIGGTPLIRLDAPALNRLYGELLTTTKRDGTVLSTTTVHAVHRTISRALTDAMRWGRLQRNPATVASPPQPAKKDKDTWDATQLRTFAASVADDRLVALWVLAMSTGLRRGEIAGLRWADLDLEAKRLRVAVTWVVVNYVVLDGTPKSKSSARTIGLDAGTVAALRAHRRRQAEERLGWGTAWNDTGLVSRPRKTGTGTIPSASARCSRSQRAGLPLIRFHAPAAFICDRRARGRRGALKVMQERLGHASLAITADLYTQVRPQVDQEAADRTAEYIFGPRRA